MNELHVMGFKTFDLNIAACLEAVQNKSPEEDIYFKVVGYLSDPEFIQKHTPKNFKE